jgi:hypothetical protein
MKQRTFGGRGGVFLRSRTGRGLSVQRRERETAGYCWIDGDRVTYVPRETLATDVKNATTGVVSGKKTLTKFLPETLRAEMIESVVSDLSGRHRRSKVESGDVWAGRGSEWMTNQGRLSTRGTAAVQTFKLFQAFKLQVGP